MRRDYTETRVAVDARPLGWPYRGAHDHPFLDHMLTLMAKHGLLGLGDRSLRRQWVSTCITRSRMSGSRSGEVRPEAFWDRAGLPGTGSAASRSRMCLRSCTSMWNHPPYLEIYVPTVAGHQGSFDAIGPSSFSGRASPASRLRCTSPGATAGISTTFSRPPSGLGLKFSEAVAADPKIAGPLSTKGVL